VPLTGWINHAASTGFAPIWWPFGQSLPLVPKSETVSALFSAGHWVFTKILLAAIALHIAGALKHAFVDRDDTLRRMLPGKTAATPATNRSRAPMLAATAIYSAAIALGVWLGQPAARTDAKQLASVNSDWRVTDGTLALTVTQFGSAVSGHFADWTAQISFDPATGTGTTDVTVNIASLSLGSVSAQALGPDFFDASNHPTAHFTASIAPQGDHFAATGILTLKGKEQPLTLPFTLDITDGTATMQGKTTLNRLDFGIGETLPDETTLKFPVAINISLTATH
jgi:polyisoprenoid-binding protein YceI